MVRTDVWILLRFIEEVQLDEVRREYEAAATLRQPTDALRVRTKNLCENLRSVLEFLAQDIADDYGASAKKPKVYFPIRTSLRAFGKDARRLFPRLHTDNRPLWDYLESVQPVSGSRNEWLAEFKRLNNQNKHLQLTLQTVHTASDQLPAPEGFGPSLFHDKDAGEVVMFKFPGVQRPAFDLLHAAVVEVQSIAHEVAGLLV